MLGRILPEQRQHVTVALELLHQALLAEAAETTTKSVSEEESR